MDKRLVARRRTRRNRACVTMDSIVGQGGGSLYTAFGLSLISPQAPPVDGRRRSPALPRTPLSSHFSGRAGAISARRPRPAGAANMMGALAGALAVLPDRVAPLLAGAGQDESDGGPLRERQCANIGWRHRGARRRNQRKSGVSRRAIARDTARGTLFAITVLARKYEYSNFEESMPQVSGDARM